MVPTSLLYYPHTLPSTVVTPYQVIFTGYTKDADLGPHNFDLHPHLIYLPALLRQKVTSPHDSYSIEKNMDLNYPFALINAAAVAEFHGGEM